MLSAGQVVSAVPAAAQSADPAAQPVRAPAAASVAPSAALEKRVVPNRTIPAVTRPDLNVRFGDVVDTAALMRARVLPEPLRPIGQPTPDENLRVARALEAFAATPGAASVDALEAFAASGQVRAWQPSLLANIGTLRERDGFYSRAARLWDDAWESARYGTDASAHAVADYAIGRRLTQASTFGQIAVLQDRLKELDARPAHGAAVHDVEISRESLWGLTNRHDEMIFSGVEALRAIVALDGRRHPQAASVISLYRAPHEGTSLTGLRDLARRAGAPLEMRWVADLASLPVPGIVHLKSNHYSAIVAREANGFKLHDPALGGDLFMSDAAMRDEMSGYVLAAPGGAKAGRAVGDTEGQNVFGHCAPGSPNDLDACNCDGPGGGGNGPTLGMPRYTLHPMTAAVLVDDTPMAYTPSRGPAVSFHLHYNQRASNAGPLGDRWRHDWLAYVIDNNSKPVAPYTWTDVISRDGASEEYNPYTGDTHWKTHAQLVQIANDPPRYERRLPDGTIEVYAFPDRAASLPNRQIYLTQVIDPQGQSLTFTYDASIRLVAVADAIGQVTTLAYEDAANPSHMTKVTDPFGRSATLTYDDAGQLASVTDVIGMTSRFAYLDSGFLAAMTTPYGTTTFRTLDAGTTYAYRVTEATDPEGGTERLEYHNFSDGRLPTTLPAAQVPAGFSDLNADIDRFNSYYWSKQAMAEAPGDLTHAVITRWLVHNEGGYSVHAQTRTIPHSIQRPLESRIWYRYPDQPNADEPLTGTHPAVTARLLDDGSTQTRQATYNGKGLVSSQTDPSAARPRTRTTRMASICSRCARRSLVARTCSRGTRTTPPNIARRRSPTPRPRPRRSPTTRPANR